MHSSKKRRQSNTSEEVCKQQKMQHDTADVPLNPSFDSLIPSLVGFREKCAVMNAQMDQLKDANATLSCFNESFGAFLFGLAANGTVAPWPIPHKMADTSEPALRTSRDINTPKGAQHSPKPLTFVAKKIDLRSILDRLPLKYRERTDDRRAAEALLCDLRLKPEGRTLNEIVERTGLPKHRVTDCLNALVRIKDIIKFNPKAKLAIYRMNPTKYPSS